MEEKERRPLLPKRYGYLVGMGLRVEDSDEKVSMKVAAGVVSLYLMLHYLVVAVIVVLPAVKDDIGNKDALLLSMAGVSGFTIVGIGLLHYTVTSRLNFFTLAVSCTSLLVPGALTFLLHGEVPVHLLAILAPFTDLSLGKDSTNTTVLAACALFASVMGSALEINPTVITGEIPMHHWSDRAKLVGHAYCILVGPFGSLAMTWYFFRKRSQIRPPMYVEQHLGDRSLQHAKNVLMDDDGEEIDGCFCMWSLRRHAGLLSSLIFLATGMAVTFLLIGSYRTNRREQTDILDNHANTVSMLKAKGLQDSLDNHQRTLMQFSKVRTAPLNTTMAFPESLMLWSYDMNSKTEISSKFLEKGGTVTDVTGQSWNEVRSQYEPYEKLFYARYEDKPNADNCSDLTGRAQNIGINDTQKNDRTPLENGTAITTTCKSGAILYGIACIVEELVDGSVVADFDNLLTGCQTNDDLVTCVASTRTPLSVMEAVGLPTLTPDIFRLLVLWIIVLAGSSATILVVAAALTPINKFAITAHEFACGDRPLEQMRLPSSNYKELLYLKWALNRLANAVLEARHLVHPGALDLASKQREDELISEGTIAEQSEGEARKESPHEWEKTDVERGDAETAPDEEGLANNSSSSIIWQIKNIIKKKDSPPSPIPSTPKSPRKSAALNLLQSTANDTGTAATQPETTAGGVKKAVRFSADTKVQHLSPRHVLQSVDAAVLAMNVSRFHVHLRSMKPNAAVELFSEVFTTAVQAVSENFGTTINISGDRMLALWKCDKTSKACIAALSIQDQLGSRSRRSQPISVRIGISGGRIIWGNFSLSPSEGRGMSVVNMLGIPVNKATHLESFNKKVSTSSLMDGWVFERLTIEERKLVICRPVEIINYKRLSSRKDTPLTPVYEFVSPSRYLHDPTVGDYLPEAVAGPSHFEAFNAAIAEEWDLADEILMRPDNVPVNTHVARLIQTVRTKRPPIEIED